VASGVPAWQAECLKTHRRGTLLLVSFGTCITLGSALAYWLVYAFSFAQPSDAAWRVPIVLAAMFTLPALLIISFMPESPR
jgi:MFS family permease